MELDRILSGKVFVRVSNDLVCVHPPDAELRYLADFLSQDVYDAAIAGGAYTLDEIEVFLREQGLWTGDDETELDIISRDMETIKVDYFSNFHFKSRLKHLKGQLEDSVVRHNRLLEKRLYLAEYTAENSQSVWREAYILERTAKLMSGELAVSRHGIDKIVKSNREASLSDDDIRKTAKSNEWRSYWAALKVGVSPFSNTFLTQDQSALITWSKVYDNVYESMDCPPDDVIQDDIALDGWFISQSRKRKSERLESQHKNDGAEVFVPVKYRSTGDIDTRDVADMNSPQAKQAMRHKMKELKERGAMNELDYSGTRAEIQMYANRNRSR